MRIANRARIGCGSSSLTPPTSCAPHASIRAYTEAFRLGAATDPETLERAMARTEAEVTRMGVLVEDLLPLARLNQLPARNAANGST